MKTLLTILFAAFASTLTADDLTPSFTDVVPASDLINMKVTGNSGEAIGRINEVFIDRDAGVVAFLAVRRIDATRILDDTTYLPASTLTLSSDGKSLSCDKAEMLQAGLSRPNLSGPVSLNQTKALAKLYTTFNTQPYWDTKAKQSNNRSLIAVDELDNRIIRDADWRQLGRVKEVMVVPHGKWQVAYLSVGDFVQGKTSSDRVAVPMAAFVRQTLSPTWLLEVSADAELLKQTFRKGQWPTEIDRGWTEFVHVKYGTNPSGGLQQSSIQK